MNIPRGDRRISEPSTVHNRIIFRDFPARIHITPLLDRSVLSQFSKKFIVWNFHPSPATLLTPPPLPRIDNFISHTIPSMVYLPPFG